MNRADRSNTSKGMGGVVDQYDIKKGQNLEKLESQNMRRKKTSGLTRRRASCVGRSQRRNDRYVRANLGVEEGANEVGWAQEAASSGPAQQITVLCKSGVGTLYWYGRVLEGKLWSLRLGSIEFFLCGPRSSMLFPGQGERRGECDGLPKCARNLLMRRLRNGVLGTCVDSVLLPNI